MPELAPFVERDFAERKKSDINEGFSKFLPSAIAQFIDKHPTNRQWFWEVLEQAQNPDVLCAYLLRLLLNCTLSSEFRASLAGRLLNLLEAHPHLMTIKTTDCLYSYGGDKAKRWLNKHIDLVIETCSEEPFNSSVLWVANRWKKLHRHLSEMHGGFEEQLRQYRSDLKKRRAEGRHKLKRDLPDFRLSPIYQKLDNLYRAAKNGDKTAYKNLERRMWGDVEDIAVATHMIGKLHEQYDVTQLLLLVLKRAAWNGKEWSPILSEAGEALLNIASAQVWESMVDIFFIQPQFFTNYFIDWIAYLTDRLEGHNVQYSGRKLDEIDQ